MWSNRKARFTIVMALLIAMNVVLWLLHRGFGYTIEDHPNYFLLVFLVDLVVVLGFAFIGLITACALAFRPEAYLRAIERSIAKRKADPISN
jgi:hypothetical protein